MWWSTHNDIKIEPNSFYPRYRYNKCVDIGSITLNDEDVTSHLLNVNTSKGDGPDNISPLLLKNCAPYYLQSIFIDWKISNEMEDFLCDSNIQEWCQRKYWKLQGSSNFANIRKTIWMYHLRCFDPEIPRNHHTGLSKVESDRVFSTTACGLYRF